jgi:hypothetical protein
MGDEGSKGVADRDDLAHQFGREGIGTEVQLWVGQADAIPTDRACSAVPPLEVGT